LSLSPFMGRTSSTFPPPPTFPAFFPLNHGFSASFLGAPVVGKSVGKFPPCTITPPLAGLSSFSVSMLCIFLEHRPTLAPLFSFFSNASFPLPENKGWRPVLFPESRPRAVLPTHVFLPFTSFSVYFSFFSPPFWPHLGWPDSIGPSLTWFYAFANAKFFRMPRPTHGQEPQRPHPPTPFWSVLGFACRESFFVTGSRTTGLTPCSALFLN